MNPSMELLETQGAIQARLHTGYPRSPASQPHVKTCLWPYRNGFNDTSL